MKAITTASLCLTLITQAAYVTADTPATKATSTKATTQTITAEDENFVPKPSSGHLIFTYFDKSEITNIPSVEAPESVQLDTSLKLPLGTSGEIDSGLWVYNFVLKEREFRFDEAAAVRRNSDDDHLKQRLYEINVPITYLIQNDNNSRWVFNVSPGVKSSLEYIGNDDLAANAAIQYTSSVEGHGYNLGAAYTHRFGEGKLVPLVNYSYKSGKYLSVILGFPYSRLSFAPTARQHYFAKLTPEGGSWHVYNQGDKDETFDFEQQAFRFGFGAEFNAFRALWLGAEAGMQFGQELELDNESGERGTLELEDSGYLQLTAKLRFR